MSHQMNPRDALQSFIDRTGLTIESEFVPFSRSRHAKPERKGDKPWKSLNWRVTVKRAGKAFMTIDYSAGTGHCPASNLSKDHSLFRRSMDSVSVARAKAIDEEIETGKQATGSRTWPRPITGIEIKPDTLDVFASLGMDSSIIDAGGFENWASDLGFDPDSRRAATIYHASLEHALALRAAIGPDRLEELQQLASSW